MHHRIVCAIGASLLLLAACERPAPPAMPQAAAATSPAASVKPPVMPGHLVHVLEVESKYVSGFSEGLAIVQVKVGDTERYGYIDTAGKLAIEPRFDGAALFSEGRAMVQKIVGKRPLWGFIDRTGALITDQTYDGVTSFKEGVALVAQGNYLDGFKIGFIDPDGRFVLPLKYRGGGRFADGIAPARLPDRAEHMVFIDRGGKIVLPGPYDSARPFSGGLAAFAVGRTPLHRRWGFIDRQGKKIIAPMFEDVVADFDGGRAIVHLPGGKEEHYAIIDQQGRQQGPARTYMRPFSEGLAAFQHGKSPNEKWGFVDGNGNVVVEPKFDDVADFFEGLAGVRVGDRATGRWGFIDRAGKTYIEPQYYQTLEVPPSGKNKGYLINVPPKFNGGLAVVRRASDMKWVIIARE